MASATHYGLKEADIFKYYTRKVGTKNIDDMLHYIWKFDTPRLKRPSSWKNELTADRLRIEGHCFYRKRKLTKALQMYNLSIMKAPHPVVRDRVSHEVEEVLPLPQENGGDRFRIPDLDPTKYGGKPDGGETRALSLGFVGRSAILFDLKLYKECLEDIDLAVEYGCPEEAYSTLQARKEHCIAALQTDQEKSFEGAPSSALSLDPEDEELPGEIADSYKRVEIPVLVERNPRIPSLSSALNVINIEGKGRSIVATRDIKPGEVIGVDRAYTFYIDDEEMVPTMCSTCLYKTLVPLPCPGCTQVVFCSKACRARGLAEDHWLECKIVTPMAQERARVMVGAYKMLKTLNHPQFCKITEELRNETASYSSPESLKGFSPRGTYSSSSYRSVHHLHHNLETHRSERLFSLCLAASRVARVIEQSGRYFVNALGEAVTPTKEDLVMLSRALVVNADKLYKNMFECGAWGKKAGCSGLFPTVSFFNHSCSPSVGYRHHGRSMVMYAQLPIKAGEEASIGYADGYYFAERQDRQKYLRGYGFDCKCRSCEEDWDGVPVAPLLRLKCLRCGEPAPDEEMVCPDCCEVSGRAKEEAETDMESLLELLLESPGSLVKGSAASKLEFVRLCSGIELLHGHMAAPCGAIWVLLAALESWF
ncbi:SET and MYND domain-containing protein 4-like [Macrobrachium rosenbergii]|uniref:SET and MYND domain-containing protein 4-like n=1 Tax=Macrobrachium rosenbergii TaxID=79674 RepID=UPI0034D4A931